MLSNDKIHPRLAFEHSGLFADPEVAYMSSMEYAEQRKKEAEAELKAFSDKLADDEKSKINSTEDDSEDDEE